MRRKPKSLEELTDSPELLFHSHHLVGAASVVAHWMSLQEDKQVRAMGERLDEAVSWFYKPEKSDKWERPPTMPPAAT